MERQRAIVVGAGVGGLTAALGLRRGGWDVTVLERAAGPSAPGAGIVLAPNALRAFRALAFDVASATGSAVPAAMGVRLPGGAWLNRARTAALTERYGTPPLAVHRAALTEGLTAALPPDTVRYGTTVRGVHEAGSTVRVRTDAGDVHADVVIAADGIHSRLRDQCFPGHPGLAYSGETAWRTVISADRLPGLVTSETWGRGERFGIVPLADGRVYVFATAAQPPRIRPADPLGELRRRFGPWHHPVPDLLARIDPGALLQHDLFDLAAPLPRLHHGRTVWIGDAAHAMTPNLGQGGCQAIEDAVVLSHLLAAAEPESVPQALAAYSAARLERTDAIRIRSRKAGRMAGLRNPVLAGARNLAVRAVPARLALRALDGLYEGFTLPAHAAPVRP
ncbi:FAD-dependent monooxygenase [Streptomyces ficellus]|uniref:Monooxygenase n=1 Tax=Streptomyces ficellus TaxID=1977088 RepID=A0A6I6F3C1_9ACTN|nr:FAD-dependent monooxygenase [Streptomyces ficellus]QGV77301.1 monooxygenase [Streptomyces ficellus]